MDFALPSNKGTLGRWDIQDTECNFLGPSVVRSVKIFLCASGKQRK